MVVWHVTYLAPQWLLLLGEVSGPGLAVCMCLAQLFRDMIMAHARNHEPNMSNVHLLLCGVTAVV